MPRQYARVRAALALTMGAEALVVMKDVCQLDEREAKSLLANVASTILDVMALRPDRVEATNWPRARSRGRLLARCACKRGP